MYCYECANYRGEGKCTNPKGYTGHLRKADGLPCFSPKGKTEKKMETKVCKTCGRELPLDKFSRNRYGAFSSCKECVAKKSNKKKGVTKKETDAPAPKEEPEDVVAYPDFLFTAETIYGNIISVRFSHIAELCYHPEKCLLDIFTGRQMFVVKMNDRDYKTFFGQFTSRPGR